MGPKLPQPTKEQYKITCYHGSTMLGITGILHDIAFKTFSEKDGGAGHQGVYAKGFIEEEDNAAKNKESGLREIHKVATGNKDRCGIIMECRMVTLYKAL